MEQARGPVARLLGEILRLRQPLTRGEAQGDGGGTAKVVLVALTGVRVPLWWCG